MSDVSKVIADGMTERLNKAQPVLNGILQEGTLFFHTPKADLKVSIEPTALFNSELTSENDINRPDREIRHTLESLALALKEH